MKSWRIHMKSTAMICRRFGIVCNLSFCDLRLLNLAAEFHDIGKMLIKDISLLSKDKITKKEFSIIRRHPILGADYLLKNGFKKDVAKVIRHHHERWDGNGYPDNLTGKKIPYLSRIIAIADSFDAMTTERTYKSAFRLHDALIEIDRCAGSQFDPYLAEKFIKFAVNPLDSSMESI